MNRKNRLAFGASLATLALIAPTAANDRPGIQKTTSPVTTIDAEDLMQRPQESASDFIRRWCPRPAQPITVGTNSKVGSGAQFKKKAVGALKGLAGGLLGGGGGGGGRSSGPGTIRCKIKNKNMTVFTDPLTGIELQVGARRDGDNVEIFSRVKDSPDRGTFQTAYVEREGGDFRTPVELGMCDLYGEFKLTVSWTKDTYVNGQHVDHQEGGWSELGNFRIPGMVSSDARPDGYWRMLGFSNASAGARQIKTTFALPEGSLASVPTSFTIHVTQPSQDPVITVPFTVMVSENDDGFVFSEAPQSCAEPQLIADNAFDAGIAEGAGAAIGGGGPGAGVDGGAAIGAAAGGSTTKLDEVEEVDVLPDRMSADTSPITATNPQPNSERDRKARQRLAIVAAQTAAKAGFLSDEAAAEFGLKNARPPEAVENFTPAPGSAPEKESILNEVESYSDRMKREREQAAQEASKPAPATTGIVRPMPSDFSEIVSPEAAAEFAKQGLLTPEAAKAFDLGDENDAARTTKTEDLQSSYDTRLLDQKTFELKRNAMLDFADFQSGVARDIDAVLDASYDFRSQYGYIASTSTEMQGLLQDWEESKEIYENVDLAFAMANLAAGSAKLGVKSVKWFAKRRADRLAASAAKSLDEAVAAAAASYEKRLAEVKADWLNDLAEAEKELADAVAGGQPQSYVDDLTTFVERIRKSEPQEVNDALLTGAEKLSKYVDNDVLLRAREHGIDVESVVARAADDLADLTDNTEILLVVDEAEWVLLRRVANKLGWRTIPDNIANDITVALFEARQAAAGLGDGLSPKTVDLFTKLKSRVTSHGLDFSDWMLSVAGEVANGVEYFEVATDAFGVRRKQRFVGDAIEGIMLYYDEADVALINAVIDSGGDVNKLRTLVGEAQQAALNALIRNFEEALPPPPSAMQSLAGGAADAVGGAVGAHQVGAAPFVTAKELDDMLFGPGTNRFETAAYTSPSAGQRGVMAENVLTGTGGLGETGMGGYVDSFGVSNDSVLGELWDFMSEPVTTVAAHRYTHAALDAYETLLDNNQSELIEMVLSYDEALLALEALAQRLGDPNDIASNNDFGAPALARLQEARAGYVQVFKDASTEWRSLHGERIKARIADIDRMIADLSESLKDFEELSRRVGQLHDWMEELRVDYQGAPQPTTALFNPIAFLRATSTMIVLKALASDAFGLSTEPVFRFVKVKNPDGSSQTVRETDWVHVDESIDSLLTPAQAERNAKFEYSEQSPNFANEAEVDQLLRDGTFPETAPAQAGGDGQ